MRWAGWLQRAARRRLGETWDGAVTQRRPRRPALALGSMTAASQERHCQNRRLKPALAARRYASTASVSASGAVPVLTIDRSQVTASPPAIRSADGQQWVDHCRPRTSAVRQLNLAGSFPALNPSGRLSQPDPKAPVAELRTNDRSTLELDLRGNRRADQS